MRGAGINYSGQRSQIPSELINHCNQQCLQLWGVGSEKWMSAALLQSELDICLRLSVYKTLQILTVEVICWTLVHHCHHAGLFYAELLAHWHSDCRCVTFDLAWHAVRYWMESFKARDWAVLIDFLLQYLYSRCVSGMIKQIQSYSNCWRRLYNLLTL